MGMQSKFSHPLRNVYSTLEQKNPQKTEKQNV